MTDKTLLRQALDALEAMQASAASQHCGLRICDEAIDAIRAELAKPQAEPSDLITRLRDHARSELAICQEAADEIEYLALELQTERAAAVAHAKPQAEPALNLRHCACEFDGDTCVTQCKLHGAHVDAIHEWAERAKAAEAKLAAPSAVPMPLSQDDIVDLAQDWAAPNWQFVFRNALELELFARRVLQAPSAVTVPLTDEQIATIYVKWSDEAGVSYADLMRRVEQAHGIKGDAS